MMLEKYDVFLSHNSVDKPAVELLAHRMVKEAGLNPFLDKWHLIPGESWQEALEDALQESATVAVFIGPEGVSPWHNAELRTAIDKAVQTRDEYRVIPVLLPDADPDSVSAFLSQRTWVDFRNGLDDQQAFERLVAGIKGEAIHSGTYELPDEPAPYRGLLRFETEQTEFFFGREEETQNLIVQIEQNSFVAVIGASGSGKSSLVRAGLLAALKNNTFKGSSLWQTRVVVPGSDPLYSLAVGLCTALPVSERKRMADQIKRSMLEREDGLRQEIATLFATDDGQTPTVFLIIDQFEEIFTQCKEPPENCRLQIDAFIANLADAVTKSNGVIRVLITLRADFLGRCLELQALTDLLQNRQVLLSSLKEESLRKAIVMPAQVVGAYFEKGLVSAILRDVEDNPDALPLLQVALDDLWQARRGPWLTLDAYEASGGVHGALERRAQSTYDSLSKTQQKIAKNMLLRMTALQEGVSYTRRRVSIDELYLAGTAKSEIEQVLETLSGPQARLIVTKDSTAEMAHEALISGWPVLEQWLEDDDAGLRIHRALTQDAEEWIRLEKDTGALYRGVQLDNALAWAKENDDALNPLEQEFLAACQENRIEEQKLTNRLVRGRRVQTVLVSTAVLLVVGLVIVVLGANGFFADKKMSGYFNVAVADFGEYDSNGEIIPSETGQQISQWAANDLRDAFVNDKNVEIWPNQGGFFSRTNVGLVLPTEAITIAKEIQANLIIYGTIDSDQQPAQLELGFSISPLFDYKFADIQGNYSPGPPIRIVDLENPGFSVRGELKKQASVVAFLVMGVTHVQLGQSKEALETFKMAEEVDDQSALVQFFLGQEYLFLSDLQPENRENYRNDAENAFKKAIHLDPQAARAHIGLGSVYLSYAIELVDETLQSGQAIDPQASDWADQAEQSYQHVIDMNPDAKKYGNPVKEVALMALGSAFRIQAVIASLQGDLPTAMTKFGQAITAVESASSFFEAELKADPDPTIQRYLVQTYEFLGEAYQWQGYAYELASDISAAQTAYQQASDYYEKCINQSENTSDLIVQDEIVSLYCQPYQTETQARIEILSGEQ